MALAALLPAEDTKQRNNEARVLIVAVVDAPPLSPIGLSGTSCALERAIRASHRGCLTFDKIEYRRLTFQMSCNGNVSANVLDILKKFMATEEGEPCF